MSEYEPGTVAVATVNGVEGVRVFMTDCVEYPWFTSEIIEFDDAGISSGGRMFRRDEVTDVRPRVVLDLCGYDHASLPRFLREVVLDLPSHRNVTTPFLVDLARQIEEQTRPPKPPEPQGLGAVVEDTRGQRFVRIEGGWWSVKDVVLPWQNQRRLWSDIDVARVLSTGVEP